MIMKKMVAIACAGLMMATALTGCSSGGDDKKPAAGDGKTLKVAAFEGGYGKQLWENLAKEFEKTHEGVTVELVTSSKLDEELNPKIKAKDYPDVIQYNVGQKSGFTESLVKDKQLEDISDVFEGDLKDKMADGFVNNTITQPYGDGKTYLAPLFYSPCGFWYDQSKFGEGKYTLPTTWDEMFSLGDQLKSEGKGTSLFTYPKNGYFDAVIYGMLNQAGGNEFYGKALNYDKDTWNSEAGTKVINTLSRLVADYTDKDVVANANSDNFKVNQQNMIDGKALFQPNGNWVIGEMSASTPEDFKYGFMALPAFEEGGDRYSYTFFEQMYVPKGAANKDLAKEFIKFMYSDEAIDIMLKNEVKDSESGKMKPSIVVQPVKGIVEKLDGDNKLIYSIYEQEKTFPSVGAFATTKPIEGVTLADSVFAPIDSILEGKMTGEEWKAGLNTAWEKFRGALE